MSKRLADPEGSNRRARVVLIEGDCTKARQDVNDLVLQNSSACRSCKGQKSCSSTKSMERLVNIVGVVEHARRTVTGGGGDGLGKLVRVEDERQDIGFIGNQAGGQGLACLQCELCKRLLHRRQRGICHNSRGESLPDQASLAMAGEEARLCGNLSFSLSRRGGGARISLQLRGLAAGGVRAALNQLIN
jgi:hypothetical protein